MASLDFLNKNMYRKYPLRSSCTMSFIDGTVLPSSLITSMQVSVPYGKHKLFVSKVFSHPDYLSLTINDYATGVAIGCFNGRVTKDFEVITLTPFLANVSGSLTTGKKEDFKKLIGTFFFRDEARNQGSRDFALLEDSVIFCFTPPGVTKLTHEHKSLTGHVTTKVSSSMAQTKPSSTSLRLGVTNLEAILSNNEFSGDINSCPTPIIKRINTVTPDEYGNIDIYGIVPVTIGIGTGEMNFDTALTITDVCPEKNKISPPVNNSDTYYDDITTTESTEWRTWDRFAT